jgi:hypothetical protein
MGANLFGFVLLLVIGVVFSFAGIASMIKRWQKRSWIDEYATIKSIETKLIHDEGSYVADVVSYEYGASQHQGIVQTAVGKHQVGQTLKLSYNPVEPSCHELRFRADGLLYLTFELGGIVALFFAHQLWKGL